LKKKIKHLSQGKAVIIMDFKMNIKIVTTAFAMIFNKKFSTHFIFWCNCQKYASISLVLKVPPLSIMKLTDFKFKSLTLLVVN